MAGFVASILESKNTNRGLFIHVDITNGLIDESWPETDLGEINRLLKEKPRGKKMAAFGLPERNPIQ